METISSACHRFAESSTWDHVHRICPEEPNMWQELKSTLKAESRTSGQYAANTQVTGTQRWQWPELSGKLGARRKEVLWRVEFLSLPSEAAFPIHPTMSYKYDQKDSNSCEPASTFLTVTGTQKPDPTTWELFSNPVPCYSTLVSPAPPLLAR